MKRTLTSAVAAVIAFIAIAVQPSGTQPVMYINITDHDLNYVHSNKETYVKASAWIADPSGEYNLGSEAAPVTLTMKGRGNYTWSGFDKKPYRLKFDSKQSPLGMNSNKHFGLLAHADDWTGFLRNTVGFRVSELMGLAWTPEQRPCEVVVNGEYLGLYMLTELIKDGKNRVNIEGNYERSDVEAGVDSDGNPIPEDYYTGGWIIEIDNYETSPHVTIVEKNSDYDIWLTYDKMVDDATEAQKNFITEQFERINELIYGDKDNDDALWELLDLDDAARFYIVQELTSNTESYHGSCYLWRNRGLNGNKWHFGPVWDFGSSLSDKKEGTITHAYWHQVWIAELVKHPKFMNRVHELYAAALESLGTLPDYVRNFSQSIAEAAKADKRRWPDYGQDNTVDRANTICGYLASAADWAVKQGWVAAPPTPPTPADDYTVYFHDPEGRWPVVYAWIWDRNNANDNFTGGRWPGQQMSECTDATVDAQWSHTISTDKDLSGRSLRVVFSGWNSRDDAENNRDKIAQTGDLDYVSGATYTADGMLGIDDASAASVQVTGADGCIVITADRASEVTIADIAGRADSFTANAGTTVVPAQRGLYIVRIAGRTAVKVAVR